MIDLNRKHLLFLIAIMIGVVSGPALAQDDAIAELDRLVAASAEPGTGVAFSREQAAAGDLLGALATLERVLLAQPGADEARLLHVGLLCRLDDGAGARAELAELAGRTVPEPAWAEAEAACGPLVRPAPAAAGGAR
jgi:hypothetical protein